MIKQDQIGSSYPVRLLITRVELLAEREALVISGLDPDRIVEIDEILADVEAGFVILLGD